MPAGHGGQPVNDLARHLTSIGVEVIVVSLSTEVDRPWERTDGGLKVVLVPMRRSPRRRLLDLYRVEIGSLRAAARREAHDLIHAHWTYAYAHAALSVDRQAIVSLHDSPARLLRLSPSPGLAALTLQTAWTARLARNVVATSPYVAGTWVRDFRGRQPLAVLPNIAPDMTGVKRACFSSRSLVTLGHPHPNKNLTTLIDAWPLIRQRFPDISLNVAGAGTEKGGRFDTAHGASKRGIGMIGPLPRHKTLDLLGSSSLMVHPSLSEACPMSAIEAVSLGMPCVAGNQAGPMDWMLGQGGMLVDVRDKHAIADAVTRILSDQSLYERMGQEASRASRKFEPQTVVPKWVSLYQTLLGER